MHRMRLVYVFKSWSVSFEKLFKCSIIPLMLGV